MRAGDGGRTAGPAPDTGGPASGESPVRVGGHGGGGHRLRHARRAAGRLVRRAGRDDRGQILVVGALTLAMLLAVSGLALDVGAARLQRETVQAAADAAAMAGADDLPGSVSQAVSDARAAAAANGLVGGANGVTVTTASPPTDSRSHNGDPNSFEVRISVVRPTLFLRLFHIDTITVTAQAVATATPDANAPCGLCILGSRGSGYQSLYLNGNAALTVTGSGIADDSGAPQALYLNGNVAVNAGSIGVVGGYYASPSVTLNPQPVTGIPPVPDPLAGLSPPAVSGPDYGAWSRSANGTYDLSPGIYSCISATGNINLNLQPGIYVLTGNACGASGSFDLSGNVGVDGTGVMLYLTCPGYSTTDPAPCAGDSPPVGASLQMNGNVAFDLTAPSSGPYQGLLLFYDRGNQAGLTIDGNDGSTLRGTVYARDADATLNGDTNASQVDSMLIVDRLDINGNSDFTIGYTPSDNYPVPARPGSSVLTE